MSEFDIFKNRPDIKDLPLNEQYRKFFYYKSDKYFRDKRVSVLIGGNAPVTPAENLGSPATPINLDPSEKRSCGSHR